MSEFVGKEITMKSNVLWVSLFIAVSVLLGGCATPQPAIQPTPTGTLFTYPHQPLFKMEIDRSLEYLGEIDGTHSSIFAMTDYSTSTGIMVSCKTYLFAEKSPKGVVKRGCAVSMLDMHEEMVYWKSDQFERFPCILEKSREAVQDSDHGYAICLCSLHNDAYLSELNLKVSRLYLAKSYSDIFNNNRSLLMVTYYEDIYREDNLYKDPREWFPVEKHSISQKKMIEEFKARAALAVRFLPSE